MPLFSLSTRQASAKDFSTQEVACEGYLHKEGNHNKDFRRRWFVLTGTVVTYHADETAAAKGNSKGSFTLTAVGHVHIDSKTAAMLEPSTVPLCFFLDAQGGRRYICFAESYKDKILWLRALCKALGIEAGVEAVPMQQRFAAELARPASEAPAWAYIAEGIRLGKAGDVAAASVSFDSAVALAGPGASGSSGSGRAEDAATVQAYARYEHGRMLLSRGQLTEATQLLEVAAQGPCASDWQRRVRLQLAWCYGLAEGRRQQAIGLYAQVLDKDPLCLPAFLDRGKIHIRSCVWEGALGDFAHVAALGKADANVCNDIVRACPLLRPSRSCCAPPSAHALCPSRLFRQSRPLPLPHIRFTCCPHAF